LSAPHFIRRPKNRWKRFVFFRFRWQVFPKPFIAQRSYVEPLEPWFKFSGLPPAPQLDIPHTTHQTLANVLMPMKPFTVLAPVTAWKKKNWPLGHWKKLIDLFPDRNFVILGGPGDVECKELAAHPRAGRGQSLNMAGRVSLLESCAAVSQAECVISADTGMLHAADQLGVPTIALIGPTAFGYPARSSSRVLEVDMPCKPCSKDGRGPCTNPIFQKCMVEIRPEAVHKIAREISGA
jgi:heptosyltransferase-2